MFLNPFGGYLRAQTQNNLLLTRQHPRSGLENEGPISPGGYSVSDETKAQWQGYCPTTNRNYDHLPVASTSSKCKDPLS